MERVGGGCRILVWATGPGVRVPFIFLLACPSLSPGANSEGPHPHPDGPALWGEAREGSSGAMARGLMNPLPTACNPSACRAVGRGLQPKGVRVKETADFKVYTKGAGSGELKVIVKGPSKSACSCGGQFPPPRGAAGQA